MNKELIKQLIDNVDNIAESIRCLIDFIEDVHRVSNWGMTPLDDAKYLINLVEKDLEKIIKEVEEDAN